MKKYLQLTTFASFIALTIAFSGCSIDLSQQPTTHANQDALSGNKKIEFVQWTAIKPGVDIKQEIIEQGVLEELFTIVRIDPTKESIVIGFDNDAPATLETWQSKLNASVVINASYFDPEFAFTTRNVIYGESYGPLLTGNTGLFRTTDGSHWSIETDTDTNSKPQFSLQSYPVLMHNGKVTFTGGSDEPASRTVVATDQDGMVYFIITEYGVLSLRQLAEALHDDLSIPLKSALNLDGGTSSGISVVGDVDYSNTSAIVPSVLYLP